MIQGYVKLEIVGSNNKSLDITVYNQEKFRDNFGWKFNLDRFHLAWQAKEDDCQIAVNNNFGDKEDLTAVDLLEEIVQNPDLAWQRNPAAKFEARHLSSGIFVIPDLVQNELREVLRVENPRTTIGLQHQKGSRVLPKDTKTSKK